jgi:hypothetical protein
MADTTLRLAYPTGATLYAVIRNEADNIWNGTSYESPNSTHWTTYATSTPETPAGFGHYVCQFPTSSAAGSYSWEMKLRVGGSPAISDPTVGTGSGYWTGTTFDASGQATAANSTLAGYNNLLNSGTVNDASPTATSFVGSSNFSTDSNLYRTLSVCFTNGVLQGAKAVVTNYNGTTKRFTFTSGFAVAPANGDAFTVI